MTCWTFGRETFARCLAGCWKGGPCRRHHKPGDSAGGSGQYVYSSTDKEDSLDLARGCSHFLESFRQYHDHDRFRSSESVDLKKSFDAVAVEERMRSWC